MYVKNSVIKESVKVRESLQNRFIELDLRAKEIIADASKRKMRFTVASFSRYMKHGNVKGTLPEEAIVWLCCRYGIDITLHVGKPEFDGKKISFKVQPYDEKKCLEKLKKIFG